MEHKPTDHTEEEFDQEEYPYQPEPEKILMAWEAPSRPYKKRNREYYTTIAIIVFLISLILFFAGQFLPIAVVIAVAFVSYVLAAIPPDDVQNALTTYGIQTGTHFYYWEETTRFWFTTKFNHDVLNIEIVKFPGTITLLVDKKDKDSMEKLLMKYLPQETPLPNFLDSAAEWLQEKIPLDIDDSSDKKKPEAKK